MRQDQRRVVADPVRVRTGISVLNQITVQAPCTPTSLANPTVIGLDPVKLGEQREGCQPGPREDDSVEVVGLFGTANRVTLEQLRDRGDA